MASNGSAPVGISKNINQIGRTDLPGGGSIVVENGYAYVGHIDPPHGTSILDVHDAKHPKLIAQLEVPAAFIGGADSDVVRRIRLAGMRPKFSFRKVAGGHLFPFEHPREAARSIAQALAEFEAAPRAS